MKLEQATLALRPRTVTQCLDLALVMLRAHGMPLLKLWALVVVPVCVLVYLGVLYAECTLRLAIIAFWLTTIPLGVLMVAAAAPSAFGETPSVRGTLRSLRSGGAKLLLKIFGARALTIIGSLLILIPSIWGAATPGFPGQQVLLLLLTLIGILVILIPGTWVAIRTGFLTEQAVLSRLDNRLYDHRAAELIKAEFFDLLLRGMLIVGYCAMLILVLFVTLDVVGSTLSFPILFGRLTEGVVAGSAYYDDSEKWKAVWLFLTADPLVVTSLLAVALAVYPVGRLAWLLCYIDLRVRSDCWDMEVSILNEARRLEES